MVRRIVFVEPNYIDDSPFWDDMLGDRTGNNGGEESGLSPALRAQLIAWNDEAAWGMPWDDTIPPPPEPETDFTHLARGFDLAALVQEELGDTVDVWYGSANGLAQDAEMRAYRWTTVLISAVLPGAVVERWQSGRPESLTIARLGGSANTARALVAWRKLTERAGTPFGDATSRAAGLRVAGLLQREVKDPVAFRGGVRRFAEYDHGR